MDRTYLLSLENIICCGKKWLDRQQQRYSWSDDSMRPYSSALYLTGQLGASLGVLGFDTILVHVSVQILQKPSEYQWHKIPENKENFLCTGCYGWGLCTFIFLSPHWVHSLYFAELAGANGSSR